MWNGCAAAYGLLGQEFAQITGIEGAFLYGSFAARLQGVEGPAPHDIDVMVIGTPEPAAVYDAGDRVGDAVHRPVNPTILTRREVEGRSGFLESLRRTRAC